jgi:hypothetical protein
VRIDEGFYIVQYLNSLKDSKHRTLWLHCCSSSVLCLWSLCVISLSLCLGLSFHLKSQVKTNLSGHTHKIVLLVFRSVYCIPSDSVCPRHVRHQLHQTVSGVMSCLMHAGISNMHARNRRSTTTSPFLLKTKTKQCQLFLIIQINLLLAVSLNSNTE